MTEPEKSSLPWTGEHGYITLEMIKKYVPTAATPIYYLAGPKAMVTTMRNLLTTAGISNDDIRFEEFSGY
jgi:ferredoxin-NADP reductase